MDEIAKMRIDHGAEFPWDATDAWWESDPESGPKNPPPAAKDWAHAAARGIIADLTDRRGIKYGFNEVDEEVRIELVETLSAIIRTAAITPY